MLLAVDGSEQALRAARFAAAMRRAVGEIEIVPVNVQEFPEFRVLALYRDEIMTELVEAGRTALADPLAILKNEGYPVEGRIEYGDPADRIIDLAEAIEADWIVMGTRGLGAVAGLMLGSVVTKVLHRSKVPVTAVP
jgi:nucleotide-binding universal stress UspA family protein